MMTEKERVIRTLTFDHPDMLPVQSWALDSVELKYGKRFTQMRDKYCNGLAYPDYDNPLSDWQRTLVGDYTDAWGIGWRNYKAGIYGEAKFHPLENDAAIDTYKSPKDRIWENFDQIVRSCKEKKDKFLLSHWAIDLFERMQHLRGVEQLFIDIMEESNEFFKIRDIVYDFYEEWLKRWLATDVDGVVFSDDWGTQISTLISPVKFKTLFLPMYRELMGRIKRAGKYVFMHSDGYIVNFMPDLIEAGVDAFNVQVWCMNVDELSEKFRGKITFWGELNRQKELPFGTVEDIRRCVNIMKDKFMYNGGGLIGVSAPGDECPFENIEAGLRLWNND